MASEIVRLIAAARRRGEFADRFRKLQARFRSGDEVAGGDIWRLVQRALSAPLHSWARRRGRAESPESIADALTDAVMKTMQPGCVDPDSILDPRSWLLRCAKNRLLDEWRRAAARPRLDVVGLDGEIDRLAGSDAAGATDFVDPIDCEESGRLIRARVQAKCRRPDEWQLIRLRYLEEAPIEQQARVIRAGHLPRAEACARVKVVVKRIRARPEPRLSLQGPMLRRVGSQRPGRK
ncbi:MAG: sigma factor [Vicinamibacterales bacterium]